MNTVEQAFHKIIPKKEGNVLAIGVSSFMYQELQKNEKIVICDVLSKGEESGKRKLFQRNPKTFDFKKIRKTFGKKQKDMIIGNIQELKSYFKTFIQDSIYITKGTIYLYSTEEYDFDLLVKRYKRFQITSNFEKCKDGMILKIEVRDTKNSWVKEKFYYIMDTVIDIVDAIGDALVN